MSNYQQIRAFIQALKAAKRLSAQPFAVKLSTDRHLSHKDAGCEKAKFYAVVYPAAKAGLLEVGLENRRKGYRLTAAGEFALERTFFLPEALPLASEKGYEIAGLLANADMTAAEVGRALDISSQLAAHYIKKIAPFFKKNSLIYFNNEAARFAEIKAGKFAESENPAIFVAG